MKRSAFKQIKLFNIGLYASGQDGMGQFSASISIERTGVVAWTPTPLILVAACLLEADINAAQIQR
jgi:hypothetical protein